MRTTTVSSGLTTTQALTSGPPTWALATPGPNGSSKPSASPLPTAAAPTTNERRFISGVLYMPASSRIRGGMDRRAHLLIGPAATEVGDLVVDIGIGRLRLVFQQRRNRHDHPALAIPSVRHVMLDPGFLHLVQRAVLREPFDRGDLLAVGEAHRHRA